MSRVQWGLLVFLDQKVPTVIQASRVNRAIWASRALEVCGVFSVLAAATEAAVGPDATANAVSPVPTEPKESRASAECQVYPEKRVTVESRVLPENWVCRATRACLVKRELLGFQVSQVKWVLEASSGPVASQVSQALQVFLVVKDLTGPRATSDLLVNQVPQASPGPTVPSDPRVLRVFWDLLVQRVHGASQAFPVYLELMDFRDTTVIQEWPVTRVTKDT